MCPVTRFNYLILIIALYFPTTSDLCAQGTFSEAVDRALGSNQELVNGIQFSNQYIRSEGQPYWLDGRFRAGSVCINEHWYEKVRIRYNLYSQRVELEYYTTEGNLNQIMTVPEMISAFLLEGCTFRRVQIGEEAPAYYQILSEDGVNCYISWSRKLRGSRSSGTIFGTIEREYWIQDGERWMNFKNQGSFLRAFPKEKKKSLKKLLGQLHYNFRKAGAGEMEEMLLAGIHLLKEGGKP